MSRISLAIMVGALAATAATLTGCGAGSRAGEIEPRREMIVYPTPPEIPRIQFLTRYSSSRDIEPEKEPSFWDALAGESNASGQTRVVQKPYGIAAARNRMYVCDTGTAAVDIIDVAEKSFTVLSPRGLGKLSNPVGCSVDPSDGSLYVADIGRRQIVVFAADGSYRTSFGEREGIRPSAVFIAGDSVLATDMNGRRLAVYDRRDRGLLGFVPADSSDPQAMLYAPTNVFVTSDRIYVTDFGAFQVKIYDRAGHLVQTIGSYGSAPGQFIRPKGLAVDRDGNVYVVDAGFENVQMFNRDGQLLMYFAGPYQGPGDLYLPAGITIDYENLDLYRPLVHEDFELKYVIIVTSQYGPDKLNVYGFVGPEGGEGPDVP